MTSKPPPDSSTDRWRPSRARAALVGYEAQARVGLLAVQARRKGLCVEGRLADGPGYPATGLGTTTGPQDPYESGRGSCRQGLQR